MKDGTHSDLTIIAIGSSAGGLEAIRDLVATLPVLLPVSYVVVQHMSPHHKSLMTQLVSRSTALKVQDVVDGVRPEANVIYITPPKADVVLDQGVLRLMPQAICRLHQNLRLIAFCLAWRTTTAKNPWQ